MLPNYMIFRPESPAEVPFDRLVAILHTAFAVQDGIVDPPSSAKSVDIAELQGRFARDVLLLARDDQNRIIGQIWIEDTGQDAYLYKLSVDPDIARGGIGTALVRAACDHAARAGKQAIRLHVRVELTGNIAFFKSQGFAIVGEGVHEGYDRTTFWKMARSLLLINEV
ncbi:GNAT family N-acetyltransferase [Thalassospira sp.]|uniref:GNAT family N-acetyltransferase n=1 Tax=Thalassospira sp. TaxID=1912094 RepID=UPI00273459DB|nr:GNAT family N-acetyltransferase [Thalassospira sp.]MDP2696516.1 GNAT family N-acetyltransferase [Thalassospira sp.]